MSTSPLPAQAKPAAGPGDDIQFPDGGGSEALRLLAAILYTVRNAPKDSMAGPFWDMYRAEAEEYDNEFLRRYGGDLDIGLLFAGLFSTVSTSFLVMMQPDLSVDPSRTTHALLRMMVHALNQTAFPDGLAELPDAWSGPSTTVIWVQSLLYASLGFSLFAALGAVLGKQWLSEYSKVGERGTVEARCRHRQRKFTGLEKWHLRTVLELVPIMLQISLLLFGVGLSAYIWDRDRILGAVVIAANGSIFEVDWPVTIDVFPMLTRLLVAFSDCFRAGPNGQPRLVTKREVAIASSKAFLRLYWERRYISPHEMLTRPLYGEDSVFADSSSIPITRTSPWLGVLTIEEPDPELHFAQELMIDTMYSHLRCTVDDRPNGRHWASSQRIDLPDLPPHVLSWFSPIMAHMLSDQTFLPTSVRRTLATFIVKTLRPSLPNPEGTLLPNAKVSATPNPEVSYHLISAAFLLGYKPDASKKVNFLRSFKSPYVHHY
ncbi:hypothetical protein EUX98_g2110 [Antrodiella citrinella]|uniref:DUF6535 domain-containing protein n=1 Tax=Antrodiella citrinella TaxID=2447956 RepID=A0A4S4N2P7_9APHY|nr:hypothetical protein EUX98_g2110 [Antrodiella citrinella]